MTETISVEEARQYLLENLDRPKSLIKGLSDKAVIACYEVTKGQFDRQALEALQEA